MTKPTDNSNVDSKLLLRRQMLKRYHGRRPLRVFDCCAGDGELWKQLRREFRVGSYLAVDRKPSTKGRLRINDSVRLLKAGLFGADVIDIDAYGSPWKHWLALLPHVKSPTTVFLTFGQWNLAGPDRIFCGVLGLNFTRLKIPSALLNNIIRHHGLSYMLAAARRNGLTIVEAIESTPGGKLRRGDTRYFAIHLRPASK